MRTDRLLGKVGNRAVASAWFPDCGCIASSRPVAKGRSYSFEKIVAVLEKLALRLEWISQTQHSQASCTHSQCLCTQERF
jgi:hypothetical protein